MLAPSLEPGHIPVVPLEARWHSARSDLPSPAALQDPYLPSVAISYEVNCFRPSAVMRTGTGGSPGSLVGWGTVSGAVDGWSPS